MALDFVFGKLVKSGDKVELYTYNQPVPVGYARTVSLDKQTTTDSTVSDSKRLDNLLRARQSVRRLVWCNIQKYSKFLTLTYSVAEFDIKRVRRDLYNFRRKLSRRGYDIQYLYVLEHQKKRGEKEGNAGSLHVHMIIFNNEYIPVQDIKDSWTQGKSMDIHKIDDVKDLGAYVCKYITKETVADFGGHCYECSQGLKRPQVELIYSYGDTSSGLVARGISSIAGSFAVTYESQVQYDNIVPDSFCGSSLRSLNINYKQGTYTGSLESLLEGEQIEK